MRRILALLNLKGGSGKTTTAVNLAEALGARGHRTLLVDLDPQASASAWLGVQDSGQGLLDALAGQRSLAELVQPTGTPGVDVVPSGLTLTKAEGALLGEIGADLTLRGRLEGLEGGPWSFVLLDCPPGLNILARNALTAAGELLIPVEARMMAVSGLVSLINTVSRVRQWNPGLRYAGILICRVDVRTRLGQDTIAALRQRFPDGDDDGPHVLQTIIRESIRLGEAPGARMPIAAYAPGSTGAVEYSALADELLKQE